LAIPFKDLAGVGGCQPVGLAILEVKGIIGDDVARAVAPSPEEVIEAATLDDAGRLGAASISAPGIFQFPLLRSSFGDIETEEGRKVKP